MCVQRAGRVAVSAAFGVTGPTRATGLFGAVGAIVAAVDVVALDGVEREDFVGNGSSDMVWIFAAVSACGGAEARDSEPVPGRGGAAGSSALSEGNIDRPSAGLVDAGSGTGSADWVGGSADAAIAGLVVDVGSVLAVCSFQAVASSASAAPSIINTKGQFVSARTKAGYRLVSLWKLDTCLSSHMVPNTSPSTINVRASIWIPRTRSVNVPSMATTKLPRPSTTFKGANQFLTSSVSWEKPWLSCAVGWDAWEE